MFGYNEVNYKSLDIGYTEGNLRTIILKMPPDKPKFVQQSLYVLLYYKGFHCIKVIIVICFLYNLYYYKSNINKTFALILNEAIKCSIDQFFVTEVARSKTKYSRVALTEAQKKTMSEKTR